MKVKNSYLVKFTVVAGMIGLFSPSVQVQTDVQANSNSYTTLLSQISMSLFKTAEARRAVNRGAARTRPARSGNRNVNRNYNRNHNINRNVNRNVNVNVNHRYYGGYGRGYGYYGGRPVLAFTTGLVIGSVIAASTMPTTCTTVVANGISYRQCGSSYYQPFYQGDTLVYKVVASPF